MAEHNEFGKEGEEEAAAYLIDKGYSIRHRNWHCGKKELDIVAEYRNELIVIEVKTRKNTRFGNPEDAVTDKKLCEEYSKNCKNISFDTIDEYCEKIITVYQ